jgi:iron complex transport system substrate-binding protein
MIVIAPCGFDAAESARRSAGVEFTRLVPDARIVVVDGDGYYSRPGPRLADGVRQLGHLLHPEVVPDPGLPLIDLAAVSVASRS